MISALFRKLPLLPFRSWLLWPSEAFFNYSCYAYLEKRYNQQVRQIASFLFLFYVILMNPLLVYTPSLAFAQVSGINLHYITPILVFVCVFYTTFGGLRWANLHEICVGVKMSVIQNCEKLWRLTRFLVFCVTQHSHKPRVLSKFLRTLKLSCLPRSVELLFGLTRFNFHRWFLLL